MSTRKISSGNIASNEKCIAYQKGSVQVEPTFKKREVEGDTYIHNCPTLIIIQNI